MKIKNCFLFLMLTCYLLAACSPTTPQYKTQRGKKKLKHYNSIQYR